MPRLTEKYSRLFSLISYALPNQIHDVMKEHRESVRGYCFILHDKDENEPHFHILIRTFSAWKPSQICRWFSGLADLQKNPINTFSETVGDLDSLVLYLTHSDPKSIEAGKHRYNADDIFDYGFLSTVEKNNSKDNSYEIIERILMGSSVRDMVRVYGREYVYHFKQYHILAREIFRQEKSKIYNLKEVTFLSDSDELPF